MAAAGSGIQRNSRFVRRGYVAVFRLMAVIHYPLWRETEHQLNDFQTLLTSTITALASFEAAKSDSYSSQLFETGD